MGSFLRAPPQNKHFKFKTLKNWKKCFTKQTWTSITEYNGTKREVFCSDLANKGNKSLHIFFLFLNQDTCPTILIPSTNKY